MVEAVWGAGVLVYWCTGLSYFGRFVVLKRRCFGGPNVGNRTLIDSCGGGAAARKSRSV